MVKPDIWIDEGFLSLSIPARLLWIGIISGADDEGRGLATDRCLKALVFPGDEITLEEVRKMRLELAENMNVQFYEAEGREYYQLTKWKDHQKVEYPKHSTLPKPEFTETSPKHHLTSTCNELTNELTNNTLSGKPDPKCVESIVQYLNAKTGREFTAKSKVARKHILARLKDGHGLDDFKRVIDFKVGQWGRDEKMAEYLRPETLFGTKFDSYLAVAKSGVKVKAGEGYPACPVCGKATTSRRSGVGAGRWVYVCACGGMVEA